MNISGQFIFTPTWGNDPIWFDEYILNGFKLETT